MMIESCLEVSMLPKWGMDVSGGIEIPGISAEASQSGGMSVDFACGSTISGSLSLVCSASIAVILARLATMEGYVLTINGGYIYLGKKK